MTELVQYLIVFLLGLIGWGVKSTHSQVIKINGSVLELKEWTRGHEELDKTRFADLEKNIERLEK